MLIQRLKDGPPVLMDGAMNTELSNKGFVFNELEWLRVNIDAPESVAEVHAGYARAGSELHIANSFANGKHVLEVVGEVADFEAVNRAAVEICRDAIHATTDRQQWIAGSLSTYAVGHDRDKLPAAPILEDNYREQAVILADAGCDMLALEMLADVSSSIAMLKGAAEPGIPVSLGLVCEPNAQGTMCMHHRTIGSTNLKEALPRILDATPSGTTLIVTVMHTDIVSTAPALKVVRDHWDGLIGAYPHTGHFVPPGGWDTSNGCSPEEFANACEELLSLGVCFVGGCCGIGPEHIEALGNRMS